jgi:hypothetical protein
MKARVLKTVGNKIITVHLGGVHLSVNGLLPAKINPDHNRKVKDFFKSGEDLWCITSDGEHLNVNQIL